jgi:hypothetical protein
VTWRNRAEREKLRVSARLTKSSSHLVSMAGQCIGAGCPTALGVALGSARTLGGFQSLHRVPNAD